MFEIGPVDGQTGTPGHPNRLNADGLAWTVILPNCDGDVFDLEGTKPFDRMMLINESPARFKATYTVWGTNHDFYNTQWQVSDSPGCVGQKRLFPKLVGSPDQRSVSSAAFLAFFRGSVGAAKDSSFVANFDPQFALPSVVTNVTRVDRGYTDSPSATVTRVFDDFANPPTNSYVTSNVQFQITGVSQHDISQRASAVSWNPSSPNVFFQSNSASPADLSAYKTLDVRLTRQCGDPLCRNSGPQYHTSTNFSMQLITGSGSKSGSVQAQDFVSLTGPVGSLVEFSGATPHPMFLTARVPLSAFSGADLTKVTGVRFTFDDTNTDQIFIANIRASKVNGVAGPSSFVASQALPTDDTALQTDNTPDQNTVKTMKSVVTSPAIGNTAGVEITLTSNRPFLPAGQVLTLQIGSQQFDIGRFGDD